MDLSISFPGLAGLPQSHLSDVLFPEYVLYGTLVLCFDLLQPTVSIFTSIAAVYVTLL
jgi:hypothetical protein